MPTPGQVGATSSDMLQGWKDIASHLGRSVRAVQRWERELDLPVHRIQATTGQTVYALRTEIDDWKKSRDLPKNLPEDGEESSSAPAPDGVGSAQFVPDVPTAAAKPGTASRSIWTLRLVVVAAVLAIGVAIGKYGRAPILGPVSGIQLTGTEVVAYDSANRVVWTHDMGEQVSHPFNWVGAAPSPPLFLGSSESTIVPIRFSLPERQSSTSDALVAFDRNGRMLWKFVPTESMHCGAQTFGAPWRVSAIIVAQDVAHPRVWIAYDHHTWWPSLLFEIDADGHATLRYMQTGWIRALAEWQSPHGHFLGVGGVLNEFEQPSATILDLSAPPATTPHGSPQFGCQGTPAGTPAKVFRFPNLDLIGATASTYAMATVVKTLSDGLQIELGEGAAEP